MIFLQVQSQRLIDPRILVCFYLLLFLFQMCYHRRMFFLASISGEISIRLSMHIQDRRFLLNICSSLCYFPLYSEIFKENRRVERFSMEDRLGAKCGAASGIIPAMTNRLHEGCSWMKVLSFPTGRTGKQFNTHTFNTHTFKGFRSES